MPDPAYLRYSNRTVTKRAGGRYDLLEIWCVPGIVATGGGIDEPDDAWQHEALSADDLPQIGDVSADGGYVCVSVSARSLDDQGTAYVDVRWQEDPLTLVTEVHYFSSAKTKPAWLGTAVDITGGEPDGPPLLSDPQDVRNSAGDRFDPPVTYEVPLERIEVILHRSLQWHDRIVWSDYLKHWNADDFVVLQADPDVPLNGGLRTFPAGSLMLMDKRAPLVKEPYFHRLVTCTFLYDPDLWGTRVPDMGPRCFQHLAPSGAGGVTLKPWTTDGKGLGPVTDAMARPYSGAAELDGNGNQLIPEAGGKSPQAHIHQWWACDADGVMFHAEFDDLDLFTPERTLNV